MGTGASPRKVPSGLVRPEGLKQLNGSVFELFRPEGVPKVEVIFFHGLQLCDYKEAFWKTWLSRDGTLVWPRDWLGPSLQNARITSISYDASARMTSCSGVTEMYQIIENLMQDVVLSPNFNIDQNSTVILVGHSTGGLIIKQLLLKCIEKKGHLSSRDHTEARQKDRIKTFLRNCRGIFYYSTPHAGSELAAYADVAHRIPGANLNMPIISFLRVLSSETARINSDFSKVRHNKMLEVATGAIGELHDTPFAGLSRRVVPEVSARQDVGQYYSVAADHFEVCKAENNTFSNIFTFLKEFICKTSAAADAVPDLPSVPTDMGSILDQFDKLQARLEDALAAPVQTSAGFGASSSTSWLDHMVLPRPTKINDNVSEVHNPSGQPSIEMVFFHGLQLERSKEAYLTTWTSADGSELWLRWLLEDFPDARILVISYDAHATKTHEQGRMDMYCTRENLVHSLLDARVGQHRCPVVLVGHCLGGLVMKEVCVQANSILVDPSAQNKIHLQNLLETVKGLFFYASPHDGSVLADSSTWFSKGSLFADVRTLTRDGARRNEDFRKLRKKYQWRTYAVVESLPITVGNFSDLLVTEASARHDVDEFYYVDADHFNICKPRAPNASSYKVLSQFMSSLSYEFVKEDGNFLSSSNVRERETATPEISHISCKRKADSADQCDAPKANADTQGAEFRSDAKVLGLTSWDQKFNPSHIFALGDLTDVEEHFQVHLVFFHEEAMADLFGIGLRYSKVSISLNKEEILIETMTREEWKSLWMISYVGDFRPFLFERVTIDLQTNPVETNEAHSKVDIKVNEPQLQENLGGATSTCTGRAVIWEPIWKSWIKDFVEQVIPKAKASHNLQEKMLVVAAGTPQSSAPSVSGTGTLPGTAPSVSGTGTLPGTAAGMSVTDLLRNAPPRVEEADKANATTQEEKQLVVHVAFVSPDCPFFEIREGTETSEQITNTDKVPEKISLIKPTLTVKFFYESREKRVRAKLHFQYQMGGKQNWPTGWFQDNLRLSFGSTDPHWHYLKTSQVTNAKQQLEYVNNTKHGKSFSSQHGGNTKGNVQGSVPAFLQVTGEKATQEEVTEQDTRNEESMYKTTTSLQVLKENTSFVVRNLSFHNKLEYGASFWLAQNQDVSYYFNRSGSTSFAFQSSGLQSNVSIETEATWVLLDDKIHPYVLEGEKKLSKSDSSKTDEILQIFRQTFSLNHNFSQIFDIYGSTRSHNWKILHENTNPSPVPKALDKGKASGEDLEMSEAGNLL